MKKRTSQTTDSLAGALGIEPSSGVLETRTVHPLIPLFTGYLKVASVV